MVPAMTAQGEHDDGAETRAITRKRLRQAALELQARRDIATGLHTTDLSLAERAQALGFDQHTAKVLDLLPVIHVAWADGEVQTEERQAILRLLEARNIAIDDPAHVLVSALLERHPGQVYLDETLSILHDLVASNKTRAEVLVDLCYAIAEAHGAQQDPIDPRERETLFAVAEALGDRAQAWVQSKFGER